MSEKMPSKLFNLDSEHVDLVFFRGFHRCYNKPTNAVLQKISCLVWTGLKVVLQNQIWL